MQKEVNMGLRYGVAICYLWVYQNQKQRRNYTLTVLVIDTLPPLFWSGLDRTMGSCALESKNQGAHWKLVKAHCCYWLKTAISTIIIAEYPISRPSFPTVF